MLLKKIEETIQHFENNDFIKQSKDLFKILGYEGERGLDQFSQQPNEFLNRFDVNQRFQKHRGHFEDWKRITLLFQYTDSDVQKALGFKQLFESKGKFDGSIIESYLFIALELVEETYNRTKYAEITRHLNKIFDMPALILFKSGQSLTLGVIHRRLHKRNKQQDVLEKVTLLKDIRISNPHRAHLEILNDLALSNLTPSPHNFVELHQRWQRVLDTKELNKKFYKEVSQWYFWAIKQVNFPNPENIELNQYHAQNLIRLLTRLLFVWFVKEKQLIPDQLFEEKHLNTFLESDDHSRYYKAILQNLFFATLNQIRGKRQFRKDKQQMNVTNLMRYERYFNKPEEFLTLVESIVPFMNGGLFECLDKPHPDKKGKQGGDVIVYYDGFSDREDNVLKVPDFIFFGEHKNIDLSSELGTKHKSVQIRGLIDIFKQYKFTVTENTPIEEDVALDPELLGQVFENLLATYNPETGTTARKQTGSFYTPREIVDYMVDESLIAYLNSNLQGFENLASLRKLLNYSTVENPFNTEETLQLINAIDHCKVLDPACGSGAFPMGVLHKLVHCLHILDPQNKQWKERQLEKAHAIDDDKIREQLINDIEEAFNNNELDYGRKLYLIENGIYGIDIQSIAIQISKLRFFISLMVDQQIAQHKENFGVRPLPNLETKFVAANTLIGIEKPKAQSSLLSNKDIEQLEQKLKNIRHRIFSAKTPKTKRELREQDKILREQIGELLEKHGLEHQTAVQLAQWNPYDQNMSSSFFDPEWMFGVSNGFDIVIGNPPYVQIQKFSGQEIQKQWENQKYQTFVKTGDIYTLFIEKGISLLKQNGLLTFITSNKWMRAGYGKALRKFLAIKTKPLKLIDFGDSQLFENATTYTNILITQNNNEKIAFNACVIQDDFTIETPLANYFDTHKKIMPLLSEESWVISSSIEQQIKAKIEAKGIPLKDWDAKIYRGITTSFNEAFVIDTPTKERLCSEDPKSTEIIKPILRGRDIKRYKTEWDGLWIIFAHRSYEIEKYKAIYARLLEYKPNLEKRLNVVRDGEFWWQIPYAISYLHEFEKDKIVWLEMSPLSNFTIDSDKSIVLNTAYILASPFIKYIVSVVNSKVIDFYFLTIATEVRGATRRYTKQYVEQMPIPKIPHEQQQPFIELVEKILLDKKAGRDTKELEEKIDQLVYKLYELSEEEINIVEGK